MVRGQHGFAGFCQAGFVVGVDAEKRLPRLQPVPDLVVDEKADRVVHRIGLFGPPRAQRRQPPPPPCRAWTSDS